MTDYKPTEDCEMPTVRTKEIFERMDVNKDGVLSKDEFIRGCLGDDRLSQRSMGFALGLEGLVSVSRANCWTLPQGQICGLDCDLKIKTLVLVSIMV